MPTPPDTPTTLESSPELTTAMDVSLATEPLATVVSMVDTLLDTLATLATATVDTPTESLRLRLRLTLLVRLPTVFPSIMPTPPDTPTMLESSLELTTVMDVCPATGPLATVDTTVATLLDTLATLATVDNLTPTASVRLRPILRLTLRLTPWDRLLTVFPSIMPTQLATPTMLESSPELTTATDVSLATAPLATVVSTLDTTEAMLDTLEPTSDKFTLSSHHHFAREDYTVVNICCISTDHPVSTSE